MIFTMSVLLSPSLSSPNSSQTQPSSLDIGPLVWQLYNEELEISYSQLNNTFAANCAGLAVGCIIFIPFALKHGRRLVYIVSTVITLAMAVWQSKLNTSGEMLATQVISGLSGAVSETLVQITVSATSWKLKVQETEGFLGGRCVLHSSERGYEMGFIS